MKYLPLLLLTGCTALPYHDAATNASEAALEATRMLQETREYLRDHPYPSGENWSEKLLWALGGLAAGGGTVAGGNALRKKNGTKA